MQLEEFYKKYSYHSATPAQKQYLDIKFSHIDCLVLFRMGDFYELFYDDAIKASKTLGIALTKRGKSGIDAIPMCGVPHHALENYLNKLLEDGFKVAICDQLETPEEAKKRDGYKAVVRRDVTRIITPGTIIEESIIAPESPHYLASLALNKDCASICFADVSTSNISVITVPKDQVISEIARINPKELLLSEKYQTSEIRNEISAKTNAYISFQVDSVFSTNKCINIICDFYKIQSTSSIGDLRPSEIEAIGSCLEYLSLTQKDSMPKMPKPKILEYNDFMHIDASTRRNLELHSNVSGGVRGSLFACINHTLSKTGSRLLYQFLSAPLTDIQKINARLNITDFFKKHFNLTTDIRYIIKQISDIERCLTRIKMGRSAPRDLIGIKETIILAENIQAEFIKLNIPNLPNEIDCLLKPLLGHSEIYELIDNAIKEEPAAIIDNGNIIKSEFHAKIEELRSLVDNGNQYINELKLKYQAQTGIDSLKISHNNVIGLFIDITSRNADKINNETFIHRQTTANSVRYTTNELQELETKMINAKTMLISLEKEIYDNISAQVIENSNQLLSLSNALSYIDVFTTFAYNAVEYDYSKPEMSEDIIFDIKEGRHPVVERFLEKDNQNFIHNNCNLNQQDSIWLITGPNMAGKSTFLRQNALIAILAHIGSFVPAYEAKIGVIDKIFSRIGAGDDLTKGYSTFMVEMMETSAILAQSTNRSLVILDEVGRGTSTYDGVAIAWAVLEYIHNKLGSRCLFATHYHELTIMDKEFTKLSNHTIAINETAGMVVFLHKIIDGAADKSYGLHVAKIAGLPESVLKRADEVLAHFEGQRGDHSDELRKMDAKMDARDSVNKSTSSQTEENRSDNAKLITYLESINPDLLSPREALDVLYKVKEYQ